MNYNEQLFAQLNIKVFVVLDRLVGVADQPDLLNFSYWSIKYSINHLPNHSLIWSGAPRRQNSLVCS